MANVQEQMKREETGPATLSCYRVNPEEAGARKRT